MINYSLLLLLFFFTHSNLYCDEEGGEEGYAAAVCK